MNARSAWLVPTGQTREDTRVAPLGALTPTSPVATRSGIMPGSSTGLYRISGFTLTGSTAMGAIVSPGRAVIQGADSQGAYPVALTENLSLTFTDGEAQNRIDLVVLRVYDHLYDATNRTEAVVEIIRGQAGATPTAPATPNLALPLYEVTVPAGASAGTTGIDWATALSDRRRATVAVGGILPAYADTTAGAYPGQYKDLNGVLMRWDGTAWVPYARGLGGIAPAAEAATGSYSGQYRDSAIGVLERWDGSAWKPAVPGPVITHCADAAYTSSITYVENPLDSVCTPMAIDFTAPPSGKVMVSLGSGCSPMVTGATAWLSVRIRQAGVSFQEPSDSRAARNNAEGGTGHQSVSTKFPVTGLTPGSPCTATLAFRTTTATTNAWFDNFYLCVEPL